jgi:hypothetical protein
MSSGRRGEPSANRPGRQENRSSFAKHRAAIDADRFDANAVRSDFKAGKLRERDARTLIEEAKTPQLLRDFRRLSLERAMEVWELTNDDERKQLRPILLNKKKQLENRVPAERAMLEQKLRAALSEKKARQTAMPQALRKLFGHAAN